MRAYTSDSWRPSQYSVFTDYQDVTLAFNTLSKDFLRIDLPFQEFQKQLQTGNLESHVFDELTKRRFLVTASQDEYESFLLQYRDSRFGPQPLVIYVTPSLRCNASCNYCFQTAIRTSPDGRSKRNSESPPSPRDLLTFIAPRLHDATGLKVTWFGGEPLLNSLYVEETSKLLSDLCDKMQKPVFFSMVTNGLLLDKKNSTILQKANIHHLQISLDGTEEIHNAVGRRDGRRGYSELIDNLVALPDTFRIALRINVSATNAHSLLDLLDDLARRGLAKDNFLIDLPLVFDYDIGISDRAYSTDTGENIPNQLWGATQLRLLAYASSLGFNVDPESILIPGAPLCHALKTKGYSIWPNGAITRCIHDVSTPENLTIADNPSHVDAADSMQKWSLAEVFNSGPCRTCFFLPICGGSCAHERFLGVDPPHSCPPSKLTVPDRMRWYEAAQAGMPVPIDSSRESLLSELVAVASATKKKTYLPILSQ